MILIKYEVDSIDLTKLVDPTYVGIMYLLNIEGNKKYVAIDDFCQKYNITIPLLKQVLNYAASLSLIDIATETNNNDTIIIVKNKVIETTSVDLVKISLFLGLDAEQVKNSYMLAKEDMDFFKTLILNLAKTKSETVRVPNVVINTKEDVYAFLSNSNVFDIVAARGSILNVKDIDYLIDLTSSSLSIPVLNCLVDFCIKSNEYNNLNPKFCVKVQATWENNKIESIDQAIALINTQKQAINRTQPVYIEPTYEKFEESATLSTADAQDILNNVFG